MKIEKIVVGELETNCYIVYDENTHQALIIDPGEESEKIRRFLNKNNLECLFIINTHGHIDHIGANNDFDLPIMIHEFDEEFLYNPYLNLSLYFGHPYSSRKVERLLKDGEILDFFGLTIRVIHTPGHTPGSICLKFDSYLFTGDTLFCQGIGRTDFPRSSEEDLFNSLREKIFKLDSNIIILPGHGPSSNIGKEKNLFLKYGKFN